MSTNIIFVLMYHRHKRLDLNYLPIYARVFKIIPSLQIFLLKLYEFTNFSTDACCVIQYRPVNNTYQGQSPGKQLTYS
jgi:hypothetical protein